MLPTRRRYTSGGEAWIFTTILDVNPSAAESVTSARAITGEGPSSIEIVAIAFSTWLFVKVFICSPLSEKSYIMSILHDLPAAQRVWRPVHRVRLFLTFASPPGCSSSNPPAQGRGRVE